MQLYLSGWSLNKNIRNGDLKIGDLPRFALKNGFTGIELMDRQIKFGSEYLNELKRKCQQLGCGVILGIDSDLTYPEDSDWLAQISHVQYMLDVSNQLGADKVRISIGGQSLSFQSIFKYLGLNNAGKKNKLSIWNSIMKHIRIFLLNKTMYQLAKIYRKKRKTKIKDQELKIQRAIHALKRILRRAQEYKIPMGIENHWGISSFPKNILRIVKELDSPYVGTCPDFDNFPKEVNRYRGLEMLCSNAIHVHAKSSNFDTKGEERDIDYRRCLQILKNQGYDNTITIEYEGRGDAIRGCPLTRDLILRYW